MHFFLSLFAFEPLYIKKRKPVEVSLRRIPTDFTRFSHTKS